MAKPSVSGLAAIRNVGEAAIKDIAAARTQDGPFQSLLDFCTRVDMSNVNKRVIESLIKCGAFDSLGAKRSQLLAVLESAVSEAQRQQKDAMNGQMGLFSDEIMGAAADLQLPDIEEAPQAERLNWEKENTGLLHHGPSARPV
jgi:DNA polymerase-3 subunit alpha